MRRFSRMTHVIRIGTTSRVLRVRGVRGNSLAASVNHHVAPGANQFGVIVRNIQHIRNLLWHLVVFFSFEHVVFVIDNRDPL